MRPPFTALVREVPVLEILMRFPQTWKTALLLAACTLTLSALALAQQYQILRADYGAGNQRVDVTQKGAGPPFLPLF